MGPFSKPFAARLGSADFGFNSYHNNRSILSTVRKKKDGVKSHQQIRLYTSPKLDLYPILVDSRNAEQVSLPIRKRRRPFRLPIHHPPPPPHSELVATLNLNPLKERNIIKKKFFFYHYHLISLNSTYKWRMIFLAVNYLQRKKKKKKKTISTRSSPGQGSNKHIPLSFSSSCIIIIP